MILLKDLSGDEVVEENFHIDAAYGGLSELSSAYCYVYGYSYEVIQSKGIVPQYYPGAT